MIYLDGSRLFFDIEGCFSGLVGETRKENAAALADEHAEKLCEGFAKYYGADPKNVAAGTTYKTLLRGILKDITTVVIPLFDESAEHFESAFEHGEIVFAAKSSDMKLRTEELHRAAEDSGAKAIFFTNPCCPTSLEASAEDIVSLAKNTAALVVVDESHMTDGACSCIKYVSGVKNLVVLKKLHFAGEPVFAVGNELSQFSCEINAADQAAGNVIFEHSSAIKTAERKLIESSESLYIRIKKLAVKYESVQRLYRTKADCIFIKVSDPKKIEKELYERGIKIRSENGYICIFAGSKEENEALLAELEKILAAAE